MQTANSNRIYTPPDLDYLCGLAEDVLEASRIRSGESVNDSAVNQTGGTLIRPGGRDCYPAFWVRDFAMSVDCGLMADDELRNGLALIAATQCLEDQTLPSGIRIPRGAIADHINFDGTPVFLPGTYDPGELDPVWGMQPPFDNAFWFIHAAWHANNGERVCNPLVLAGYKPALRCNGERVCNPLESLRLAFDSVPADPATGLVVCDENNRGVSFGFMDAVVHTGHLLFASLLRFQAAREMAEMTGVAG